MLSTWRDSQPCTLLITCRKTSTSSPLPINRTLAASRPTASCLAFSAKPIDLGQNRAEMLRCLDLLKSKTSFVAPVPPLGRCPRRVLRHSFRPKVFEIDQQEPGFACGKKLQAGGKNLVVCNATFRGNQSLMPKKLHQCIIGLATQFLCGSDSVLIENAELGTVRYVEPVPIGAKCWHIVRVHAGDTFACRRTESFTWIGPLLVLNDKHSIDLMLVHGRIYFRRHSAEIFTNQSSFVTMRFEAEDREKFFGRIPNIGALAGGKSLWNPVETVQTHNMIEPQKPGMANLESKEI